MPQSTAIGTTVEIFRRRNAWELTVSGSSAGRFDSEHAAIDAIAIALRTVTGSGIDPDGGSDDAVISATIEVFPQAMRWWINVAGDLFGPFRSEDEAVDAAPEALRMTT